MLHIEQTRCAQPWGDMTDTNRNAVRVLGADSLRLGLALLEGVLVLEL